MVDNDSAWEIMADLIERVIAMFTDIAGRFIIYIGDFIGSFIGGDLTTISPAAFGLTFVFIITALAILRRAF